MPALLYPRLVREHLAKIASPPDMARRRLVVQGWTRALRRGDLGKANEVQLHGEFLTHIFGDVLGYRMRTTAGDDGSYELVAENQLSERSADGALGFFSGERRHVIAPIELKGVHHPLDVRKGRAQTPVQQAWEYASRAPESRWIIVSNYVETRLYSKARGWDAYEVFRLDELDTDEGFTRFYGLLGRDTVLGYVPGALGALDLLLEESSVAQKSITDRLYETYRDIRRALFADLCRRHASRPQIELLPLAQTILDRVLFCAFAEDRRLIPGGTIARALDARNPYDTAWSPWKALVGVFNGIDTGNAVLRLPPLNGGLFRVDPEIDGLDVSADICERFRVIADYDFAEDVSVEVLGHIFEQSVSELEELRAGAAQQAFIDTQKRPSKRRAEGVFYTPSFITRYLTDLTLGEVFRESEAAAFSSIYTASVRRSKDRDLNAWEIYRESLRSLRVLDPACGSGAFLIAAFEALEREYNRVNQAMALLLGAGAQLGTFDLTTSLLNENIFGVDLNGESIEITKLSLWLKTARRDKQLTHLDANIRRGNSVVEDPDLDPWAFDWTAGRPARGLLTDRVVDSGSTAAIDARWREGFDVVLGNPPYVRQELLTQYKSHWSTRFRCHDGVADLYIYFFERAVEQLKSGGRLGFIVSNKWLRAGYGEKLRKYLVAQTAIERIIDFGHAPIFPEADAFPVIITLRKLGAEPLAKDHEVSVTQFPREELTKVEVPIYVASHSVSLAQTGLRSRGWSLVTIEESALFEKIRGRGVPLMEYAGCGPLYGIKTGLNEAFVIDDTTRDRLVREDPRSSEVLRKFLRGQDISRWAPEWGGQWMIFTRRGVDIDQFPAIKRHLDGYREQLEPRPRDFSGKEWPGRKPGSYRWYELQDAVDYFGKFEAPKIVFPDILWRPDFALDTSMAFPNNTSYILPTADKWLLAVLNSPLMWSFLWAHAQHGKDEALRMFGEFVEALPIASPTDAQRKAANRLVDRLVTTTAEIQAQRAAILDTLRMQYSLEKPGKALSDLKRLSADAWLAEVLKRRAKGQGRLSSAGQRELRRLFVDAVDPMYLLQEGLSAHEQGLARLVDQAYGLTPDDVTALWEHAPPRMPGARGA